MNKNIHLQQHLPPFLFERNPNHQTPEKEGKQYKNINPNQQANQKLHFVKSYIQEQEVVISQKFIDDHNGGQQDSSQKVRNKARHRLDKQNIPASTIVNTNIRSCAGFQEDYKQALKITQLAEKVIKSANAAFEAIHATNPNQPSQTIQPLKINFVTTKGYPLSNSMPQTGQTFRIEAPFCFALKEGKVYHFDGQYQEDSINAKKTIQEIIPPIIANIKSQANNLFNGEKDPFITTALRDLNALITTAKTSPIKSYVNN